MTVLVFMLSLYAWHQLIPRLAAETRSLPVGDSHGPLYDPLGEALRERFQRIHIRRMERRVARDSEAMIDEVEKYLEDRPPPEDPVG